MTTVVDPGPILAPGPFNAMYRAAEGPDFSEGTPYIPHWHPNALSVGRYVVIPANFGQQGGSVGYANRKLDIIGNPLEPTSLQHKPVWNVLIPSINWNLRVLTAQQLASFENAQNVQAPQVPVVFSAPGTASLLK